jgi:hypothetical protein
VRGGDQFAEGSAASLIAEITAAFHETPFSQVKKGLLEHSSFEDVNAAIGSLGQVLMRFIDPEIVVDFTNVEVLALDQDQVRHGREGWVELWRVYLTPWSDFEIRDVEIEEIDHNRALISATWRFTGESSGVQLDIPSIGLWKVRDGRGIRSAQFDTVEQARNALDTPEWQPE